MGRLFCVTGQTGSGKSSLAMDLATEVGAELLSVDSMQVYRGFDIGTAKPTPQEQAQVVHHGIDLVDADERFSAGAFLHYARELLGQAEEEGRTIIAVGGTGLYLRAMLGGIGPAVAADLELRARLRAEEAADPGSMHRRLTDVDAEASARLHPHDLVRLERAIEVFVVTGRPISVMQMEHRFSERPFETWTVGLRWDREALGRRIAERVDAMLAAGWTDEVRRLLESGVSVDATPMRAIGYPQIASVLRGELPPQDLRDSIVTACRQFAKRQATWFNREPSVEWFEPDTDLVGRILPRLRAFLEIERGP